MLLALAASPAYFTPQIIAVSSFGLVFIVTLLVLAIRFPRPTSFQYNVFRTVLSLAAAGLGATLPGFIDVDLTLGQKLAVRSGGALALFVLTYFFNPAKAPPEPSHHNTDVAPASVLVPATALAPAKRRGGETFLQSDVDMFVEVWNKLIALEDAAEQLWRAVSEDNLVDFAAKWTEADNAIRSHALFFSKENFSNLRDVLKAANFYMEGKTRLSDIRTREEYEKRTRWIRTDFSMPTHDFKLEASAQIQQNQRWLTRYKNILARIREGLHEVVVAR